MPRFLLTLEYDGAPFVGWQRQDNFASVQSVLEDAIKSFVGQPVVVYGAGRTDAGVHALGQAAHVDIDKDMAPSEVRDALNAHLREVPVVCLDACLVADDFHARFSALKRHYLYRILDRRPPTALRKGKVWRVPYPLNADAMQEAGQCLVGKYDFTTFRAAACQAPSPLKTVDEVTVNRVGDEVHLKVRARSFLHSQVRSFAGTLERVGAGQWTKGDVQAALIAQNRAACGPVAPAHGLYLERVLYSGDA